ncbi:MAG: alkaline shock response membrane anchor protein AmaP [Kiritimatiellaceae bacterium]|nr:alkaline shock response membrane anchor protein AmaP [Kiritimatiellaceae bacterium]
MKQRSGLGDLVMTILLLLIGGLLVYGNTLNSEFGATLSRLLGTQLVGVGLGAVMVLSVCLRWFGGFGKKKEHFIDFQSEDGTVGISTKAIQDFIVRVGKEFAAVKSIESTLIQDKGALDIAISVKVLSGNKIPELSQVLQQRIRESVRESLGLDEIRNITIQVSEIVGEPAKHIETEEPAK